MEYSRLLWRHDEPDLPVEVLSEYDSAGRETRKVEYFADGSAGTADANGNTGRTRLSLIERPPDGEVECPTMHVLPLSRQEFEAAWSAARPLGLTLPTALRPTEPLPR